MAISKPLPIARAAAVSSPFLGPEIRGILGFVTGSKARLAEIERLMALTDQQLAERGLRRDGIVAHVYRDLI